MRSFPSVASSLRRFVAPIGNYFNRRRTKPYVRPWALAVPVAILIVGLPLLRPLRHPGQLSHDEELRLATISALVEHAIHSDPADTRLSTRLAIDTTAFPNTSRTIRVDDRLYSDQPPMMAILLSGPYWVMHRMGYRLAEYSVLVPFILTLLGVTLPAAGAAGLVYRMARIFELRRPWRTALAAAVVFGSGLISYAVVLNVYVPAAVLVMASAGALLHLISSKVPSRGGAWLIISGFSAALAATIDPPAVVFLVLIAVVIPFIRLKPALRVGGVLLYLIGASVPIVTHAIFTVPLTGDLFPGSMHPEISSARYDADLTKKARLKLIQMDENADALDSPASADDDSDLSDGSTDQQSSVTLKLWHGFERLVSVLLGPHGIFSHFPIAIFGVLGMLAVMHRNWLATTKALAVITAGGTLIIMLAYAIHVREGSAAGFANRRFVVFLPLLLFWAGAWLRRGHHPAAWGAMGVLLAFSVIVSLIGATDPLPRNGYTRYTAAAALHNMFYPPRPSPAMPATEIAVR